MSKPINYQISELRPWPLIYKSILAGLAWSIGATFGFAIFLTLMAWLLSLLGGIPIIGQFVAKVVLSAQHYLATYPPPINSGGL